MSKEFIKIGGAREHNLKNLTLQIPRDKLVVITGLSGSGKSSLAFDTIYAEGQRKYVESLSAYARQFLDQMQKPDVDFIEGLSPAIAIEQKTTTRSPRSTVGTITEIYDYLRVVYSSIGTPHCPKCGKPISRQLEVLVLCQQLAGGGVQFLKLERLITDKNQIARAGYDKRRRRRNLLPGGHARLWFPIFRA